MCFRPPALDVEPVDCPLCGATVPVGAQECPSCGAKPSIDAPEPPKKVSVPSVPSVLKRPLPKKPEK